jgi:hypothetical protein
MNLIHPGLLSCSQSSSCTPFLGSNEEKTEGNEKEEENCVRKEEKEEARNVGKKRNDNNARKERKTIALLLKNMFYESFSNKLTCILTQSH